MKLYLAGGMSYRELLFGRAIMKLFLASDVPWRELIYSKTVINWATPRKQKGKLTTKSFLAGGESEAKECSKEQKSTK